MNIIGVKIMNYIYFKLFEFNKHIKEYLIRMILMKGCEVIEK